MFAVGQGVEPGLWGSSALKIATGGGMVSIDPLTCATTDPRVFAAGDVAPGGRTVTEAVAQGMRAAWGLDKGLRGELADRRAPPPLVGTVWPGATHASLPILRADPQAPRHAPELPVEARLGSREVVGVLDEAQARAEAARCMICGSCGSCRACLDTFGCPAFFVSGGQIRIDPARCTGCAACAAICPNGAIVPDLGATA